MRRRTQFTPMTPRRKLMGDHADAERRHAMRNLYVALHPEIMPLLDAWADTLQREIRDVQAYCTNILPQEFLGLWDTAKERKAAILRLKREHGYRKEMDSYLTMSESEREEAFRLKKIDMLISYCQKVYAETRSDRQITILARKICGDVWWWTLLVDEHYIRLCIRTVGGYGKQPAHFRCTVMREPQPTRVA